MIALGEMEVRSHKHGRVVSLFSINTKEKRSLLLGNGRSAIVFQETRQVL